MKLSSQKRSYVARTNNKKIIWFLLEMKTPAMCYCKTLKDYNKKVCILYMKP